jgi:hypothetical protein
MLFTGTGNANKISGIPVQSGIPPDGYALIYETATGRWVFAPNGGTVPPILSVSISNATGSQQLVAGTAGKIIRVLGYAITAAGTCNANFRSTGSGSSIWRLDLDTTSGKSGANLITAWPSYIFTAAANDGLTVDLTSAATVSISYFLENA